MGKAVESLSTNFHTFLQMFQHFKNGTTLKITQCFFSIFVNSVKGKKQITLWKMGAGSMESVKAKRKERKDGDLLKIEF